MKNPRADAVRSLTPSRAAGSGAAKSPIMGRSNPEKKLAKFKQAKLRKPQIQHVHAERTKRAEKRITPVAGAPVPSPTKKVAPSAKAAPAKTSKTTPRTSSQSRKATGPRSTSNPITKSLLKTVSRWLDDTRLALESPQPNTLERLGARGDGQNALGYMALSATLTALLAFRTGLGGMLAVWLLTLLSYAAFVFTAHYAARKQGGDGKLEAMGYATALYWAPLAPFTALLPFVLGGAWIPAAALVQIFITVFYALRVLNGTIWISFSGQWNALTAGIAAASALVLVLAFTLFAPLLKA